MKFYLIFAKGFNYDSEYYYIRDRFYQRISHLDDAAFDFFDTLSVF
ncbi:hypothetical protein IQ277_16135 [Nostocales cyanobacterium LEGE 12452]|nr:hypothetical protein [Nostocales cyanobacterium LEGE 12452]